MPTRSVNQSRTGEHARRRRAAILLAAAGVAISCTATAVLALAEDPAPSGGQQAEPKPQSEPIETPKTEPASDPAPSSGSSDTPATTEPASDEPAPVADDPNDLPSLDELLGVEGDDDESGGADKPASDIFEQQLERDLNNVNLGDEFAEIVQIMDDVSARLAPGEIDADPFAGDAGLATQRLQDDALRRLDALILAAENQQQQQQQQQQQSSSSQRQQQQQQQQMNQQGQQRHDGQSSDSREEIAPPSRQDGPLRPALEAAQAAWGALPERVRDSLLQGSNDTFSSMYERMTEAYYRKVAEEASR